MDKDSDSDDLPEAAKGLLPTPKVKSRTKQNQNRTS
jgi:hypothetical protein